MIRGVGIAIALVALAGCGGEIGAVCPDAGHEDAAEAADVGAGGRLRFTFDAAADVVDAGAVDAAADVVEEMRCCPVCDCIPHDAGGG